MSEINAPPRVLALDTASRVATVAVYSDAGPVAEGAREVTTHSEGLLSLIDDVLRQAGTDLREIDALVCGLGPGSFTGIRIGLATAKGLAWSAARPLLGIASTAALAAAAVEQWGDDQLIATLIDAQRRQVFCRLYRGMTVLEEVGGQSPEAVCAYLAQVSQRASASPVLIGDGLLRYPEMGQHLSQMTIASDALHTIRARALAQAAYPRVHARDFDDIVTLEPQYVRGVDLR